MTEAVSQVELAHLAQAAADMREADRLEVLASDGHSPAGALVASCGVSEFVRALFIERELAAVFGVRRLQSGAALPWVLTTTVVDRHPMAFWRASKHVVRELRKRYPVLVQCIDARHAQALRWAARLGFELAKDPHPCGVSGLPFLEAILWS